MAAESTKFLIDLQARFATLTPAQKALSSLEKQINKERDSLAALEKKLATSSDKLRQMGADAAKTGKFNAAGVAAAIKNTQAIEKQITAQKGSISAMEAALPAWRKFSDQSLKGSINVVELAGACEAASAAVMALALLAVAAAVSFIGFALASADAARSAHLLDVAAAGSVAQGHELIAVVSQLARRVPLARAKLDEMAKSLIDAKLAGRDMQLALEAVATVASARGPQAASAIEAIAKQSAGLRRFVLGARDMRGEFLSLVGTGIKASDVYQAVAQTLGITVAAAQQKVLSGTISLKKGMEILATVAKNKFGATLAGQMISLSTQMDKAKENFGLLFSGININKFLVALEKVTSLLSQDTYTGFALKEVLSSAMTGFFDAASVAMPYIRAGLIGIAIGVLTVYLHFLKAKKAVGELADKLGLGNATKGIDGITIAMYAGMGAVGAVVAILGLFAAAIAFATFPLAVLGGAIMAVVAAGYAIGSAVSSLFSSVQGHVTGAFDSIKNMSLAEAGKTIIWSLIKGIAGMAGSLASAVFDIASIIPNTVASALDMHSPSRIGVAQGGNYALSIAKGGKDKAGAVEDAGESIGRSMASGGGSGLAIGSGNGGSQGVPYVFNIYVPEESFVEKCREVLIMTLNEAKAART